MAGEESFGGVGGRGSSVKKEIPRPWLPARHDRGIGITVEHGRAVLSNPRRDKNRSINALYIRGEGGLECASTGWESWKGGVERREKGMGRVELGGGEVRLACRRLPYLTPFQPKLFHISRSPTWSVAEFPETHGISGRRWTFGSGFERVEIPNIWNWRKDRKENLRLPISITTRNRRQNFVRFCLLWLIN